MSQRSAISTTAVASGVVVMTLLLAALRVTGVPNAYGSGSAHCGPICTGWIASPGSPGTTSTSAGGNTPQACPTPPSGPGYPTNISLDCNGCHWIRVHAMPTDINATGDLLQESQDAYAQWQANDEQGILDELACYPGPTRYLMYFETPATLGQESSGQLPLDAMTPNIGPKSEGMALVNAPIYVWISPADWHTRVSAPIAIADATLTLKAEPVSVTWTMGDGGQFVCDGPGVPWSNSYYFDSYHACSYTYRHSSARQPTHPGDAPDKPSYTVTAVVNYQASWTCDGDPEICGDGPSGDLGIHPGVPATTQLPVGEVQGVTIG